MGCSGHRANILKPSYNRVGIGVVHSGGKIWVTVRFLAGSRHLRRQPDRLGPPPGVQTALTGDFDGDGYDDLLTYNPGTTGDELWFGRADRGMHRVAVTVNGQYRPVAGDFDGDGRTQILWYAPGSTADYVWEWDGDSWVSQPRTINGTYTPAGRRLRRRRRRRPALVRGRQRRRLLLVRQPQRLVHHVATTINGTYAPLVGDLDGNGGDDVFWYAPGTRRRLHLVLDPAPRRLRQPRHHGERHLQARSPATSTATAPTTCSGTRPARGADFVWFTNRTQGQYTSVARTRDQQLRPGCRRLQRQRRRRHRVVLAQLGERRPAVARAPTGARRPTRSSSVHSG